MKLKEYVNYIKLELSGNQLQLELKDEDIKWIIKKALRELQRYIDSTRLATVNFSNCIDVSDLKVSSITAVYRTTGGVTNSSSWMNDPMYAQRVAYFSYGNINSIGTISNFVSNYAAYSSMAQIRNTLSTDLAFKYDKDTEKLYINVSQGTPDQITIEYVPIYEDVEEIKSDYWIDILLRLSLAMTKVVIGRLRTYSTQQGALFELDGNTILEEGKSELNDLRSILRENSTLFYPVD